MAYISVDVETSGPNPGDYSLLAIGACLTDDPDQFFYIELIPDQERVEPSAIIVSGLDPERLKQEGIPPRQAMEAFERWLAENCTEGEMPVFVAFNAPFDWMFVADYFHRYLGRNPFGHRALDLKAFYMGIFNVPWEETGMAQVASSLGLPIQLSHHALEDARNQAKIFNALHQKIGQTGR